MSVFGPGLPTECSTNVFSYLELRDCLSFGTASSAAMREALPSLRNRRLCMTQEFAYSREATGSADGETRMTGLLRDVQQRYPDLNWISIPTVQQRVDQLCCRLPPCHPLFEKVQSLKENLNSFDDDATDLGPLSTFAEIVVAVQQVTKALRLHCEIVSTATFSDPMADFDNNGGWSLDQYIGDVLCVACLIHDSPNKRCVIRKLREPARESSCYQSFVYTHSSILLNRAFSSDERQRLVIPDLSGLSKPILIPFVCYLNKRFRASELTLVFSEFGPLGAAFRGRDTVRLRGISGRCLFSLLISSPYQDPEERQSSLEWLYLVHENFRKARPMTVRAPVLRLSAPH